MPHHQFIINHLLITKLWIRHTSTVHMKINNRRYNKWIPIFVFSKYSKNLLQHYSCTCIKTLLEQYLTNTSVQLIVSAEWLRIIVSILEAEFLSIQVLQAWKLHVHVLSTTLIWDRYIIKYQIYTDNKNKSTFCIDRIKPAWLKKNGEA